MNQIILSWTQTKGSATHIDIDFRRCQSYLISEALDRVLGMGYHIDSVVPVLFDNGVALSLANIIISKPPVRPAGPG